LIYQFKILPLYKRETTLPNIKKGPNGTVSLSVFLLKAIRNKLKTEPKIKPKNIAITFPGKPLNKPISKPSLISPAPIPFSFVIKTRIKKNTAIPTALMSVVNKD
jgi:hypothetical protein